MSLNRGEVLNCCSFNDVQNAMPQKIRSACLHDSRIDIYPIYIRFISTWMRPETDRAISEMHAFFSCLHCHRTDPICVTYEQKNQNWVTFNWQCKRGLRDWPWVKLLGCLQLHPSSSARCARQRRVTLTHTSRGGTKGLCAARRALAQKSLLGDETRRSKQRKENRRSFWGES